ncbi:MAG: TauD/TfdA family dioxygenase [Kiloniellales bacterium]|nr:TauD/TfdA family dioxygenase [Kiloniellales bacterium]
MPFLVEGEGKATPGMLADWAAGNRVQLDQWLHQAGGVLFRGFGVKTAEDFRGVAAAIRPELKAYVGGDSPRSRVAEGVYTSTEFPPHLEIGLHNELSYSTWWPERLFFCCRVPAAVGGETHIADGRRVLAELDEAVKARFADKGVLYLQHLRDSGSPAGPGKSWQETFETNDPQAVEAYARAGGMDMEWTEVGLRTSILRLGVLEHPVTGDMAWFNQADLWHASMGGAEIWEAESSDRHPHHHACYGDGSEITIPDLEAVRTAYRACEVVYPWEAGDVLVLDNRLAMHGRKPFEGARSVLVTMA